MTTTNPELWLFDEGAPDRCHHCLDPHSPGMHPTEFFLVEREGIIYGTFSCMCPCDPANAGEPFTLASVGRATTTEPQEPEPVTDEISPTPGQVWADQDPRMIGRTVKVDSVDQDPVSGYFYASCTVLTNDDATQERFRRRIRNTRDRRGKKTRIRVDRMRPGPRGYRLVSLSPTTPTTEGTR